MKVTIEGTSEKDFPNPKCSRAEFIEQMKQAVRRRLELRSSDTVEIIIN